MAAFGSVVWRVGGCAVKPGGRPFSLSRGAAAPLTAEQLAEKIRAEKQKKSPAQEIPKDPVQRRVRELNQLTQQLQRVHPNVLAKALKRGILYQNEEIVVINKPYGIPVHGGPGVKRCITDVLPILAKMLNGMEAEPLHLCHRLDKETTGVMVLARDQNTAHRIQELFRTRQVEKKYWAICVGEPEATDGVVDIPIIEKEVESHQSHFKMTLAPNYRVSYKDGKTFKVRQHRGAQVAVTRYRVLNSASSCSLVELQPVTGLTADWISYLLSRAEGSQCGGTMAPAYSFPGVKHQLRVHLAYGLGCPVLGDHKYSHWSKLAPQKLPGTTLKRLGLKQVKARYLPLHLHACELTLPEEDEEGKKIHLVSRPPRFFSRSLKYLRIEITEAEKK